MTVMMLPLFVVVYALRTSDMPFYLLVIIFAVHLLACAVEKNCYMYIVCPCINCSLNVNLVYTAELHVTAGTKVDNASYGECLSHGSVHKHCSLYTI